MGKQKSISIKDERGFTFVELLVVMALIGIMSVFLAGIMRGVSLLYSGQNLEIEVIEASNLLNSFLLDNIRRAESIQDTITDGSDTFTSGSDEIILKVPAIDGSQEPIVGVYDYYIFYQDALNTGDMRWRLVADASSDRTDYDKLAAEEITNLSISYDTAFPADASLVTVSFTLEKTNGIDTKDITRSTSINLRNQ